MTTIYDSRSFVKKLTEAGLPEQQADIFAAENLLLIAEHLATKDDFKALEAKLDATLEVLDAKVSALDTKFSEQISALDTKFSEQIGSLDSKLESMESRIVAKVSLIMAVLLTAFRFL